MKFVKVVSILMAVVALATTATAQKGTEWFRISSGGLFGPYNVSKWSPHMSFSFDELYFDGYEISFNPLFYLDVNYERMLSDRLGFQTDFAIALNKVRYEQRYYYASIDREADAGTSFLIPIMAGFNFHPFKVRRIDPFFGTVTGIAIRGPINYPVSEDQYVDTSLSYLETTDMGVNLVAGWDIGVSVRIAKIRVVGMLRMTYGYKDVILPNDDSWFSKLPASGGCELSLGLAFKL